LVGICACLEQDSRNVMIAPISGQKQRCGAMFRVSLQVQVIWMFSEVFFHLSSSPGSCKVMDALGLQNRFEVKNENPDQKYFVKHVLD
jgi:hypothetical protein